MANKHICYVRCVARVTFGGYQAILSEKYSAFKISLISWDIKVHKVLEI